MTDAFTRRGASFNKWAALEEGLDHYGRHGWLAILDADVLWPRAIPPLDLEVGKLYGPLRHMLTDTSRGIPPEEEWGRLPVHRNVNEIAGYSQIFAADDPHLPAPPWHDVGFVHAGAADSFFQNLWPRSHKVRPPWNVLHIVQAGENWFGRATPYLDGTVHPLAQSRRTKVQEIWRERRLRRGGVYDQGRYADEKIGRGE